MSRSHINKAANVVGVIGLAATITLTIAFVLFAASGASKEMLLATAIANVIAVAMFLMGVAVHVWTDK